MKCLFYTWQWWKSLRSWLLRCQRKFFLSPKVRWHLLHLKGLSLLWTTFIWRSKSPRRVNRASHKSQACGRSWACVFKCAFSEPGFMIRWHDRHSILAPSPSPTTMVRTWIRPSPSSSNSSRSSAFYTHANEIITRHLDKLATRFFAHCQMSLNGSVLNHWKYNA